MFGMKLAMVTMVIVSLFFLANCVSVPVRDSPKYHSEQEVMEAARGWVWKPIAHPSGQIIILFDNFDTTAPLDAILILDENGVFLEFWIFENGEFVLAYANGEEQKI